MFKIYKFLDSKEKIHFHLLILISVFMNFFEVFSIGMILPILDFLINGKESNLLNNIEKFVPFEINLKSLLIFFISSILLKNIFYLINKYVSVDFSTKITNKVQIKILKTYLKQNLIFINENHSSKIAKDINVEAGVFSGSYVGPVLNSISQIIIFLFIIILLSFYNFKVTFYIFMFIFLMAIIIKFFSSKKLKDLGVKRTNITGTFYRNIKEAIDFIREIKILNLYDHFTNKAEITLTNLKKVTTTLKKNHGLFKLYVKKIFKKKSKNFFLKVYIHGKTNINLLEPPIIDFVFKKFNKKRAINIADKSTHQMKYWNSLNTIKYKGLDFRIPYHAEEYLTKVYGKFWKKKLQTWSIKNKNK